MVGGSTAVIELGGLRLIIDPTFDPPGEAPDGLPRRTAGPAIAVEELGRIDVALVSHDQHPDNLDGGGRALLRDVPLVLTTQEGAARLGGGARGLAPFEATTVDAPGGEPLTITALPAQHGPTGADEVMGTVIGFLVSGSGCPSLYISGDNASIDVVGEIATRVGRVDVAILFTGAASIPQYLDGAPLTLTSADAVQAARVLGARAVLPMHYHGWSHYQEGSESLVEAFAAAGLEDVLVVVAPGKTAIV